MTPELAKYLWDIEEACNAILELAGRSSLAEFRSARWIRSSIEREFLIGEALRNAIVLDPTLVTKIRDAKSIIGFRNIVVHGYSSVDYDFVWGFIQLDLPRLKQEVQELREP